MYSEIARAAADRFIGRDPVPFFAGGSWRTGRAGETVVDMHPTTGTPLATVAVGGREDIDDAVAAARAAAPGWAALGTRERAVLLHRLADAVERDREVLTSIESRDLGKPAAEVLEFDVLFSATGLRYFADVADHLATGEPVAVPGIEASREYLPRGVCAFIIPWNAPGSLMVWGAAPALAGGNTVVVKAPELAPLSCLYLAALAEEVGFPAGVVNVVPGVGQTAGAALAAHPGIDFLSFTGSPRTGRSVAVATAANLVPSKMELGGKGAAVVFPDVDLDATVEQLCSAVVRNAGQTCCTATRWLVHHSILDGFVERAEARMRAVRIGGEDEPGTELGALISAGQRDRVQGYLDRGLAEGAQMLVKGGPIAPVGRERGYFVSPVLLSGEADNVCAQEEIFGPVAYLMPFADEEHAVALTNGTRYGLANSVWSADLDRAGRVARRLVAGNSWINGHNVFAYGLPYGGIGMSGWGGGMNSVSTYLDYLRPLTVARPLR